MGTHPNVNPLDASEVGVPWVSVTRGQVSAVIGAYRVAVVAARALSVELIRHGVDPTAVRVVPTVASDGRPAVVITVRPPVDQPDSGGSWSTTAA